MNIIELIRAQGSREAEPVIPGESIVLEAGDRIRCEPPFTEVTSIIKIGNDLSLVLSGLTPVELKHFFNSTPESVISFHDQEFRASQLSALLTIRLGFTDTEGVNSQLELLPGSLVNAHSGQLFTINAETVAIKDLHRDGYDLILNSHDDNAKIIAVLQGFFIAPEEGQKYPELQITDPAKGTAFDKMIHPHDPIFQWQGEPLPQAVVGAMYAYYFHLDAEDADKMILTAKTTEGELPAWLTFANLGQGSYLLSGLPNSEAAGTIPISIIAHSTSGGVGVHTQQAFNLMVRSSNDVAQRSAIDDVAAAEFRKAGEIIAADSYGGGILTVDHMPYMMMPEIATIVGLAALGPIAFKQPFSSEFTSEKMALDSESGRDSLGDQFHINLTGVSATGIGHDSVYAESEEGKTVVPVVNVNQTTNLISTGGLSEVESTPRGENVTTPTVTDEYFLLQSQPPATTIVPETMYISTGLNPAQSLLPFLSTTPGAAPLPISLKIADLNGQNGFTVNSTPSQNFYVFYSNIVPDINGDGFAELMMTYDGYISSISGRATPFPSAFDLSTPGITSSMFTSTMPWITNAVGIGDFNGDGINDFLAVPGFGHLAYVVFGDISGFPASTSLSTLAASGGAVEITDSFFSQLTTGTALGDMNGDGLMDVAFGDAVHGSVSVLFGSSSPPTNVYLGTLDGSNGFIIVEPGASSSTMGMTFSDINGDGYNDVIFKTYKFGQEQVHVVFGHAGGFPSVVDASTLPVGDGFTIIDSSLSGYRAFGKFITNIGDVNHDGRDDLMIVEQFTGKAFVIFGDPSFTSTTTFDVTTLDGSNGFTITHSSYVYINHPAYIGDINGDGIADIAISEFTSYDFAGAVHIIFGSDAPFSAIVDMFQTDPQVGFTIIGSDPNNSLGSLGGGGDLNGDGLNDFVVSNYTGSSILAAHVIFGANFSGIITKMGTSTNNILTGTAGDDVIYGMGGDDTIDALGGNDFINAPGNSKIYAGLGNDIIVYHPDDVPVQGDAGTDTLWLNTDNTHVSFVGATNYTGIDEINLFSTQTLAGNSITLDAATVLAMSDANLITVKGNAHDTVHLVGVDNWVTTTPIVGYTTYTSSTGSVLNIQDGVKVTLSAHFISDATLNGTDGILINAPAGYPVPSLFGETIDVIHNPFGNGFDDLFVNAPLGGPGFTGEAFIVSGTSSILPVGAPIYGVGAGVTSTLVYQGATGPFFSIADLGGFTGAGNHNLAFVVRGPDALVSLTSISGFVDPQDINGLSVIDLSNGPFNSMSVAGIGDMNADGLTDLALFSPWVPDVYVVFGTTSPVSVDLSALTGSDGFVVTNPTADFDFITNLTSININGDGFTDIAYHYTENVTNHNMVMVVRGDIAPFPASSTNSALISGGTGFNITDNAHPFSGVYGIPGFGAVMANVGDFNGDGMNDLAIGNPAIGTVYLVFGNPSNTSSFDVSSLNGTNGFAFTAPAGDIITALNFVGDVNGDGRPDMAIATYNSTTSASNIYVEFGRDTPFPAAMSLVPNSAAEGLVIHHYGPVGDNQIGAITSGDFNGDGLSDIVYSDKVGLYSTSPGGVYVIYGNDFSHVITDRGTVGNDTMTGTNGNDVMYGGAGNDTINGAGGNDFIEGGSGANIVNGGGGNDTIVYHPADTLVDGGTGNDTLWFKDDANFVDLRGSAVFSGIDEINLQALKTITGNQVTLDALEVAAMSDANALTINGGGQDSVHLEGVMGVDWTSSTPIAGYTTWTSALNSAVVNVQDTMQPVTFI